MQGRDTLQPAVEDVQAQICTSPPNKQINQRLYVGYDWKFNNSRA